MRRSAGNQHAIDSLDEGRDYRSDDFEVVRQNASLLVPSSNRLAAVTLKQERIRVDDSTDTRRCGGWDQFIARPR